MLNKNNLIIVLGISITVACLWYVLRGENIASILAALTNSKLWAAVPMLASFGLYYWIKAIRWRYLLKPIKETTASAIFPPMMIGFFGNNILPAHLGEFIRMYLVARQLELSNSQVLATIILERILDILTVVLFLGIVLIFGTNITPTLVTAGYFALIIGFFLIFITIVFVIWTQQLLVIVNYALFFLSHRLKGLIIHHLNDASVGLHAIKNPSTIAWISVSSIIQWFCMGVCIYIALFALGIKVSFSAAIVVLALTMFAVIVPSVPGFFGTIQLSFFIALKPYGVNQGDAIAASIFFHIFTYLAVLLLGVFLLHRLGYNFHRLKSESAQAKSKMAK